MGKPLISAGRLTILAAAVFLATALATSADVSWTGNGFVILNVTNGGEVYYDTDLPTANPDFTGTLATINLGDSIKLGGEEESFPALFGVTVNLRYRFDGAASFQTLNLPYWKTEPAIPGGESNDWWHAVGGNTVEIGSGLAPGLHTLEVYFDASTVSTTVYNSANGANFSAEIDVLPEPSTVLLVGLAVVGLGWTVRRRR